MRIDPSSSTAAAATAAADVDVDAAGIEEREGTISVGKVVDEVVVVVTADELLPEVRFSGVCTDRLCLVPVFVFAFSCLPLGFLLAATCSLNTSNDKLV